MQRLRCPQWFCPPREILPRLRPMHRLEVLSQAIHRQAATGQLCCPARKCSGPTGSGHSMTWTGRRWQRGPASPFSPTIAFSSDDLPHPTLPTIMFTVPLSIVVFIFVRISTSSPTVHVASQIVRREQTDLTDGLGFVTVTGPALRFERVRVCSWYSVAELQHRRRGPGKTVRKRPPGSLPSNLGHQPALPTAGSLVSE